MADGQDLEARIVKLKQELKSKKTFVSACHALASAAETEDLPEALQSAFLEAGKSVFTALQTRFSNPKFWQAGLDFFLALEFHVSGTADVQKWRDAAMEEVDEDAREKAKEQARLRRLQEDKKHNKGAWGDYAVPATQAELAAAAGFILVDAEDDRRPGMSRDARDELRLVTVMQEDVCVVCQESLIVGSKAKTMPCGHLFHDDCLIEWVKKSNSCPTCRFDEMPSEKKHFDDVQRQIEQGYGGSGRSSLYT
eukprot:CAMPEP_0197663352 /NCGR_PEP_ID=MMETSP1338-20131121/57107_1 /TAXON_ID=43686 ORGANISM="Pelagodinium beii, Strain RCC1491" /NCGR_SAMPLE_ID=MMETSP1338 /ASSEMBLY_ACC=CAM_ASM_000754 /LENGTH=251 /DNA_ID=CAMNT_0043241671 /DNA_START=24 /DNA_END=779 /DNA_ORIENTATION=-